jgi:hypothetical protein
MPTQSVFGGIDSAITWDLTNCAVMVKVLEVPNPATSGYAMLVVHNGNDYMAIVASKNRLVFKHVIGGSDDSIGDVDYDPVKHAWWRIREGLGKTYWEYSPDGKEWAVGAAAPDPIPPGGVRVTLAAGVDADPGTPGKARFDFFDLPPP